MIPKILHQVWVGEKELPGYYYSNKQSWDKLHPDWKYMLWTDSNICKLDIKVDLNKFIGISSKANVVRLYAVNIYGGVYADTDTEFIKNFNPLLSFEAFVGEQQKEVCANGIFGSVAHSLWLGYQINMLNKYMNVYPPWGPTLITEATNKYRNLVEVLPPRNFYPYLWYESQPKIEDVQDCFTVHHWACTWVKE